VMAVVFLKALVHVGLDSLSDCAVNDGLDNCDVHAVHDGLDNCDVCDVMRLVSEMALMTGISMKREVRVSMVIFVTVTMANNNS
jgi:hypothetical protein